MEQLIERIGISNFIQITLETWNSVFLLIMIFSMLIGRRIDKDNDDMKIPLTDEITIFFFAIFLYNFFDMICGITTGDKSEYGLIMKPVAEFCYYAVGEFQTLFFLQVTKKHIAERNGMKRLKNAFTAVQLLNLPLPVLLAATPFTDTLYWFDEQNRYHRGTFYPVWYYITIFSFVFIFAVFLFNFRKTDRFLRQVIVICSVIPLIAFICNFAYTSIAFNNVSVSIAALILFVLYEKRRTEVTVESVREAERVKVALEQSKNKVLMAQIQPHFIYNSLTAIRSTLDDPKKARELINHFSRFLRGSIDVLEETECIRAERELETVDHYMFMEKTRFGDALTVIKDTRDTGFFIPAFAIQTLAENAVNHGIRDNKGGAGTVTIRTYMTETEHIIEVGDDGVGFMTESDIQKKDDRNHIGLSNLRNRLEMMCGGTLEIESEPGRGTLARIKIPVTAEKAGKENENTDSRR